LKLQIRDDGVGMDDATRQKIFEPFYTTKEVGRGTGLGMSVVHGIVLSHGGWVEVASRLDSGTTVTIWLPASDGTAVEAALRPTDGAPATVESRVAKVLVVDDEDELLVRTARLLGGMGHEVRVANNVEEARATLESEPGWPDVVLADFTMNGETGLDVIEALRDVQPDTPAILMTGFGDSVPREDLEAAGVDRVLSKPFSRLELVEAMMPVLRKKS
jgi:CheY-like chemotaxis protein